MAASRKKPVVIEAGQVVPKDMPVEYCLDAAGRYEAWARHPNRQGGLDEARNQILDLCCNTRSLARQLERALAGVPATQTQPSGDSGQLPAVEAGYRDAYEGAREDLLDWKRRAHRAEAELRRLGYTGIVPDQQPAEAVAGEDETIYTLSGLITYGKIAGNARQGAVPHYLRSLVRQMVPYLEVLQANNVATPPPAIDIKKLRELVTRWRMKKTRLSARGCSNELELMLPKDPLIGDTEKENGDG